MKQPSAQPELLPATPDQEQILSNLLELYAHDFSEFQALELGSDGRFGYPQLSMYWHDPNRHPFLVSLDGKLVGLVLVTGCARTNRVDSVWDMSEFFVVRRYRRRGAGTAIAHEVWRRFPGTWKVRVMKANESGRMFWERAISAFVGASIPPVQIEKDGQLWNVFSFESQGRAAILG